MDNFRHSRFKSPWLPTFRRPGEGEWPGQCVVCFPPAGAGAGFFREWPSRLPRHSLMPVQLPGREERFGETLSEDTKAMAVAIAGAISAESWRSVTLLGYSFGALLAFETAYNLENMGVAVRHVVACARNAPQASILPTMADQSADKLFKYIKDLGGLPPEIETEPQLIEIVLPIMRADLRANDIYSRPIEFRIKAPITTMSGCYDSATTNGGVQAWSDRTSGAYRHVSFNGGHFFILESPAIAFEHIDDVLASSALTD